MDRVERFQRQRATSEQDSIANKTPSITITAKTNQNLRISRASTVAGTDIVPDVTTMSRVLKRDFNVSSTEVSALKVIIGKIDLFDESVRERWHDVLTSNIKDLDSDGAASKVLKDADIEALKEKLFLSRKELDTYISFTKKLEKEKRQIVSEKEELAIKLQWHERRLKRFEEENKSLKNETANLCKQINDLKSKLSKDGGVKNRNERSGTNGNSEAESKQRLINEADAEERNKLVKEKQKLEEELRTMRVRSFSLVAQLKHSERISKEVKEEKENLKKKLSQASLDSKGASAPTHAKTQIDSQISKYQKELKDLESKFEALQSELRAEQENRIKLEHENMALKDTSNVFQSASEDADKRVKEIDERYRETLNELRDLSLSREKVEQELKNTQEELDAAAKNLEELQYELDSDHECFKKFLERISMELKDKNNEAKMAKTGKNSSLHEQIEFMSKRVMDHVSQTKKMLEKYDEVVEERDDLEQESKDLKFVLQQRMDVTQLKLSMSNVSCDCSKEKTKLKNELEDCVKEIENLEDEVNRLHQDKQQLLMSFLNLQASKSQVSTSSHHQKVESCENEADEIRHYLGIIEDLTEEKLQLENLVYDMEIEKKKLCNEIDRLTFQ